MKLRLVRIPKGYAFADAESADAAKSHHLGDHVVADVVRPRSNKYMRRYFALLRLGFDFWQPVGPDGKPMTYRGRPVEKDFGRFRGDIAILAGFYRPVWNARGELRVDPLSIGFASMDEPTFERLYSKTIDVLIELVLGAHGFTREQVDAAVEELLRFD